MLYLVEYADWNSQGKIGLGGSDKDAIQNSGLCDSMTYHTGTNAADRTNRGHVRYRYIEDLWGNAYDFCDGIYFDDTSIYCIKNPSSFSDTSGGTYVGTRSTGSKIPKSFTSPSAQGFEYALFPSDVTTTSDYTTYVCDQYGYGSSGVTIRIGCSAASTTTNGLFYFDGIREASYYRANTSSRLMKLP